jgi:xanthine/CO dehydrogenase XdhC/CoxF family maturation factor
MGLPVSEGRLEALGAAAGIVIDNDAVGLAPGYLPGLGERAPAVAAVSVAAGVLRVVTGPPDARDLEVQEAAARGGTT